MDRHMTSQDSGFNFPSHIKTTHLMNLPRLPSYSVRSGCPQYRRPHSQSVSSASYGHSIRKGAGVCD